MNNIYNGNINDGKEVLKKAFLEAAEKEYSEYSNDFSAGFSPMFEKKMRRLIRSRGQTSWDIVKSRRKKAFLTVAIVAMILILSISVSSFRYPVAEFIVNVFDIGKNYKISGEGCGNSPETIEHIYIPSYLPEGYTKAKQTVSNYVAETIWENSDGKKMVLTQHAIGSTEISIDNDNTVNTTYEIDGKTVYCTLTHNVYYFVWVDDYVFTFYSSGSESVEELLYIIAALE